MPISDFGAELAVFFEDVGTSAIRRELATGGIQYLGINEDRRNQAREWVEERAAEEEARRTAAALLEQQRYNVIRRWAIVAALAGTVAAIAAVIAIFR